MFPTKTYFFGRPQALTYFRWSDVIRKISQRCGTRNPEALSSTKLRKLMASLSKVRNFKDNEMDDPTDFLGHDIQVHRQYHRLPEGTLQLAKISKVLLALGQGKMSKFKGKNLDESNIDPHVLCVFCINDSKTKWLANLFYNLWFGTEPEHLCKFCKIANSVNI